MPLATLVRLVNRDRPVVDEQSVVEQFARLGCEVDEVATIQQYRCAVCGKIIERTEAQGAPLSCSNCGTDFRDRPDAASPLGESRVVRLDMLAVRPDIFDPGGMARYMRGFLGVQTGLSDYPVAAPQIAVEVDPRLSSDESYRPCIACAVIRNVKLDDELIKTLMNLQEDLHWALGRNRKLASIGVYDLDTLTGETFHYDAVAPDELRFVPLGFDPASPASNLTPAEILEKHKTGVAFAHLLKGMSRYPLLRDGRGTVLSMPPIINSEATRVTLETRQFFCDVTGLSQRTVDRALNILVTSLKELMPQIDIEAVRIDAPDGPRATPDLSPTPMQLSVREAADTIGLELDAATLRDLLERMGHGVGHPSAPQAPARGSTAPTPPAHAPADTLTVRVPAWRNDVMHPVDLIEDAAIAYGYDNLTPQLVPTFTIGRPREIEEQSAIARKVLVGLGFHQVMTLPLTSEAATFDKWGLPRPDGVGPDRDRPAVDRPDGDRPAAQEHAGQSDAASPGALTAQAVLIENPISSEQTMARVSLLPGLMETLAINKQYDLPQLLFEIGDVGLVDPQAETGAAQRRLAAAVMIGTHVGYADIRAVADAFVHELDRAVQVEPVERPGFIRGRGAAIRAAGGAPLGVMGEVHPEVLERYGLRHPACVLEIDLSALLAN